jgi:hypothetical protein
MKLFTKHAIMATTLSLLLFSSQATAEESWLDKIKNAIGLGTTDNSEQAESGSVATDSIKALDEAPSAQGLLEALSNNLSISNEQASGGMGAILNYAKNNVSTEQFSEISQAIPGLDGLLSKAPAIESLSSEGLGGLLNKAAQYSDSLQSLAVLKQQFDALGLDTDMILQYVDQAKAYLDTPAGQSAKEMLEQAFGNLSL